jgi:hypothetical protein
MRVPAVKNEVSMKLFGPFFVVLMCSAPCIADTEPVSINPVTTAVVEAADNKDALISQQSKQLEAMRQQQEFQAQQIKEMQLQRQETAHQTEQQRRDAQMLRWRVGPHHGLLRNLIFDPPIKVRTPSTVTGQQP